MIKLVKNINPGTNSKILSIDAARCAEVIEENSNYFKLRLVFKLRLDIPALDPTEINKIKISIIDPKVSQNASTSDLKTKINLSSKNIKSFTSNIDPLLKNQIDLKRDLNLSSARQASSTSVFSVLGPAQSSSAAGSVRSNISVGNSGLIGGTATSFIPAVARQRLDSLFRSSADNIQKRSPYLTSINVYINDKINDALKKKCVVYNLNVPDQVSLSQGPRLTIDTLYGSSSGNKLPEEKTSPVLIREINEVFRVPSNYLNANDSFGELFGKKILDYFIHDTPRPPVDFLDNVVFFDIVQDYVSLSTIEIPVNIKIPSFYRNSKLTAVLDLHKTNSKIKFETLSVDLDLKSYFESYYDLISRPNIDYTMFDNGNATVAFSYDGDDKHKIVSFNVYIKSLIQGRFTKYKFASNKNVSSLNLKQAGLALNNLSKDSLSVVRVVPVTNIGESEKYSEIVIGNGKISDTIDRIVLRATQDENLPGSVRIFVNNVSSLTEQLLVYRRNCTNSQNENFELIHSVRAGFKNSTFFRDTNLTPGNFYEYYVETVDTSNNHKVIQASNTVLVEILRFKPDNTNFSVTVNSLSAENVEFLINASMTSEKTSTLVANQLASNSDIGIEPSTKFNPFLATDASSKEDPNTFKDLYFYEITRVSESTGESYTFPIYSTGQFFDNTERRTQLRIPQLVPGNVYYYHIVVFKRDPITITKNYISSGETNNKKWFYRPFKWRSPKVINFGTLYSDDTDYMPVISDSEILKSQPVKMISSFKITVPSTLRQINASASCQILSRNTVKIVWSGMVSDSNSFDTFVVVKVVNGKKTVLGTSNKNFYYHKLDATDLGTLYYEITPMSEFDSSVSTTYYTNSIIIEDDTSERPLKES